MRIFDANLYQIICLIILQTFAMPTNEIIGKSLARKINLQKQLFIQKPQFVL